MKTSGLIFAVSQVDQYLTEIFSTVPVCVPMLVYVLQYWRDRRLKWDIDEYYKVPVLHLYNWLVWKPDIMPWNA